MLVVFSDLMIPSSETKRTEKKNKVYAISHFMEYSKPQWDVFFSLKVLHTWIHLSKSDRVKIVSINTVDLVFRELP